MHPAEVKLGRMKARMLLEQAFFGALICGMPLELSDKHPTAATNGKKIWFNPEWVETLQPDELFFVGAHEITHNVFQHCFRRGHRDPKKWNRAADYVINGELIKAGIGRMPKGGLWDDALVKQGGGTTDGVYNLLPESPPGGGDGSGGQGPGGALDEVLDAEGDQVDQDTLEAEWKVKVAQAALAAQMAGQLPDGIKRLVEAALKPRVKWKEVLRDFLTSNAKTRRSFARPKRRWISQGIYLPGPCGEAMGELALLVDQSGSVSEEQVGEVKCETVILHQDLQPTKLHVIYFDSKVQRHDEYGPEETPEIQRYATGGTAFSPCFRFMEENQIEPVACVVITDLDCSDFGPEPDYPVLWITTLKTKAPWGRVVEMDPKL